MKRAALGIVCSVALASTSSAAQTPAPTTASAEVTECAQAQMLVDRLLDEANRRIEASRQTNNPVELRAAVDSLQATLRDVRAQLAPCAKLQPSDLHAPHVPPKPPAGGAPPAPAAPAPSAKPPAAPDEHAGHMTAPAKPAPAAKPPAADPHAGHQMPAPGAPAPSRSKPPAAKPTPDTRPPTLDARRLTPDAQPSEATDPVCGLKVDPATALRASHQGQTYYFCSVKHRDLFAGNPAKYLPKNR